MAIKRRNTHQLVNNNKNNNNNYDNLYGHTATRAPYMQLHWVGLSEQMGFKMGFK